MNILLIGREGQVAYELRRTLTPLGTVVALDRTTEPRADLSDLDGLHAAIRSLRPNLIVNAAAYTAVDLAETESDLAFRINGAAPGVLAEEAKRLGIPLVHYSTDYVFPGDATTPYAESTPTGPLGVYGHSKLAGEEAIRSAGADHLILRTAWVYGRRGKNFLLTMLRLMEARESLGIVADQWGAPTWSRMIAEATALILAKTTTAKGFGLGERGGTYHLTAGGSTSWFGFAEAIRELGRQRDLLGENCATLNPIDTSAYPTPARRPAYSVLSNDKLRETFGVALPDWKASLELCLSA